MAFYQILYWQDIPAQIKVWDDFDEFKIELSSKYITRIDQAAMEQGLISEDAYLSQWRWSEEIEYPGDAREAGESIRKELEEKK
jgi:hypothetical protein